MDGTFWLTLAGVLMAAISGVTGIWFHISHKLDSRAKYFNDRLLALEAKKDEAHAEIAIAIDKLKADHATLKLEMVRDYASVTHLDKVEGKLLTAIDRLIAKIEGLSRAVATMQGEKARAPRKTN